MSAPVSSTAREVPRYRGSCQNPVTDGVGVGKKESASRVPLKRTDHRSQDRVRVAAPGRRIPRGLLLPLFVCLAFAIVSAILIVEFNTYYFESRFFAHRSRRLTYELAAGASRTIQFPPSAPLNDRRGYSRMRRFEHALRGRGFEVDSQARWSAELREAVGKGLNPVYSERPRAGLRIVDETSAEIYHAAFPRLIYEHFDSIPPLIVQTLLAIEDKHLLDSQQSRRNPAVDWPRFLRAIGLFVASKVGMTEETAGASTLATQLEKFRYSPRGRTPSAAEKLRQMLSASYRWYRGGGETIESRKRVLLEYLNSVPLAAAPGYGEVHGLGEGLQAWFGASFDSVNTTLGGIRQRSAWLWAVSDSMVERVARSYRIVVSLIVSFRRAGYYLLEDPQALRRKTDQYLGLLHREGIIPYALYLAALEMPLMPCRTASPPAPPGQESGTTALRARTHLLSLLELPGLYDLDRIDVEAVSTLDRSSQDAIEELFGRLYSRSALEALSLRSARMLGGATPDSVIYGLTLYERGNGVNLLRIHADTYERALSLNDGTRMDLGSTAKLRTLVHYLEIIEQLHRAYAGRTADQLRALECAPNDTLRRWARSYLLRHEQAPLDSMLHAALGRTYSAHPWERFFTGGGYHRFGNFAASQDTCIYSVRAAFTYSVNLVFVRLMRDIVEYHIASDPRARALVANTAGPRLRREYLRRFTEYESRLFVHRFYRGFSGIAPDALPDTLAARAWRSRVALATVYASVAARPAPDAFERFMHRQGLPIDSGEQAVGMLRRYGPAAYSLADRAYLASLHPFELATARTLASRPNATFDEVLSEALVHVDGVYRWLYKTNRRAAQDRRIRIMLEQDAFEHILRAWQRLGFEFSTIMPSYATALGASADRPSALATLAGIIQNDGVLYPERRFSSLRFARATPYETVLETRPTEGTPVLSPHVARAVRECLFDVVERGTAVRLRDGIALDDGSRLRVGGKTGTGDHRMLRFSADGRLVGSEARSRSAVFVFIIGERYYGTITVVVPGAEAAEYQFTSSYAVQLLKVLTPKIEALFAHRGAMHELIPGSGVLRPHKTPDHSTLAQSMAGASRTSRALWTMQAPPWDIRLPSDGRRWSVAAPPSRAWLWPDTVLAGNHAGSARTVFSGQRCPR